MDVIYKRVAGLDTHRETVVATVRVMVGGKVERECRTFETTTAGLSALLGSADGGAMQPCGDGGDRNLLEPVWNPTEVVVEAAIPDRGEARRCRGRIRPDFVFAQRG